MILQIALGILLGYILIRLLPVIGCLAVIGILIAFVCIVVLAAASFFPKDSQNQEQLAIIVIFFAGLIAVMKLIGMGLDWMETRRKERKAKDGRIKNSN